MFGLVRYAFACCVVSTHLWVHTMPGLAASAVWGFYTLSGYLMTLVLMEKYGFGRAGILAFARNRALRIYPGYYAAALIMLACFALPGDYPGRFMPGLVPPDRPSAWAFGLTLVWPTDGPDLVPGARALGIEVAFYILLALGLARPKMALAAFLAGAAWDVYLVRTSAPFDIRYTTVPACALPFSLGSLLYHARGRLPTFRGWGMPAFAVGLWIAQAYAFAHVPGDDSAPYWYGMYAGIFFTAFVLATLMNKGPDAAPAWLGSIDRLAGDLSYPIYLIHYPVGLLLAGAAGLSRGGLSLLIFALPIVHVVAYAIFRLVEVPARSWKVPTRRAAAAPLVTPSPPG